MEEFTTLNFNTPIGLKHFTLKNEYCIDPNTFKLFRFAIVHGNTWQTTLCAELPTGPVAFTPSCCPESNHRGIYEYCEKTNSYNKYNPLLTLNEKIRLI